jgi:hypothetical protein
MGTSEELSPAIQEIESLFTIVGNYDLVGEFVILQRRQSKFHVSRVILNEQYAP